MSFQACRHPRGSTLVVVLLLMTLLLIGGIGFLSQKKAQYGAARQLASASEALALAEAGIEDVKIKLQKDHEFPPTSAFDQTEFSYTEEVSDQTGTVVGTYDITLDSSLLYSDLALLRVRSTGRLGDPQEPLAERTIEIEVDFNKKRTSTYFKIVSWRDLGAL